MNTEEWHADIEMTEATVKCYLQEQFASLTPIQNIQYIGEGWDNKIYLINNNIIFRFPRRKAAIKLMEQENILLNNLPAFSNIKIPNLKYVGRATAIHPYPCQGYEIIKGRSAYLANLNDQDRRSNIVTLAIFLKQLHSMTKDQVNAMGDS